MKDNIIDIDEALERVENDADLLIELVEVFLDDCPSKMEALKEATKNSDYSKIKDLAHSLKGAAGNISAKNIREIVIKIENFAKDGNGAPINDCIVELEAKLDELKSYCGQLRKKLT